MRRTLLALAACAGLLSIPAGVALADDSDFPVLDDPLLVPRGWHAAGERARSADVDIIQDRLLEPWSDDGPRRRRVRDDAQLACDCVCHDLLTPADWAR